MRIAVSILAIIAFLQAPAQEKKSFTLLFEYGTTSLTPASSNELQSILRDLQPEKITSITINGYTDKVGSEAANKKLAEERAEYIRHVFASAFSTTADIKVNSYGATNFISEKEEEQFKNRRVELVIEYLQEEETIALSPFREDVPVQKFGINLDDTVVICGKGGTCIKIPPGSIRNKKGVTVKGQAELLLKEYYQPSDIMLAGLHSESDEGLLQTGGMFQLLILQGKDTMDANTNKPVEIRMPVKNPQLKSMNVYAMHGQDTSMWNNTRRSFTFTSAYWSHPNFTGWYYVFNPLYNYTNNEYGSYAYYTNLKPGSKKHDEQYIRKSFLFFNHTDQRIAKKVVTDVYKVDSATIEVHAKIWYRNLGARLAKTRMLDTTFISRLTTSQYVASVSTLNWINCDRFYNETNVIDFMVATPRYRDMTVIAHFKKINAFMRPPIINGKYMLQRVPNNTEVTLYAIGKSGEEFYFGKQDCTTSKNGRVEVKIEKVEEAFFRKVMNAL